MKDMSTIHFRIDSESEMCTDDVIAPFLHTYILVKIRKRPNRLGLF